MSAARPHPSRRAFAPAWLGGETAASALLPCGFANVDVRIASARRAALRRCDENLVDALEAQHRHLPPSAARQAHLDSLREGNAAVVVSGQQVGLFTGPALCIYKAAGVVAAARRLSRESGVACVPVFWLQTEDHDWPEIDHCFVRDDETGPVRVALAADASPSRVAVAARRFGEDIEAAVAALESVVAQRPRAGEVAALMRRHYRRGAAPAQAFRGVLSELFGDEGLLLLDPRTPQIAALTRPLLRRSLEEDEALAATLHARAAEIENAGFQVQVALLEGAPLCFFHPEGGSSARFRLEPEGQGWRLRGDDGPLGRSEALRLLDEDPLRFSSSALLRPLVQDYLLPSAVVLAGPGEIAYFAQLGPLYQALGVEMPVVSPRPSFCVTAAGDRRRLEQLGLGVGDLVGDRETLLARLALRDGQAGVDPADLEALLTRDFLAELERFASHAVALDENLARSLAKTRQTVGHAVAALAERYRRSVLERDAVLVARLDRVRAALAPDGLPQERVYGLASLAAEHGIAELLGAIDSHLVCFDAATVEVPL